MPRKKPTSQSQDADTMIRRYIEEQGPAEIAIQEEFAEIGSEEEAEVVLTRGDSRQKHARLSGRDLDATMGVLDNNFQGHIDPQTRCIPEVPGRFKKVRSARPQSFLRAERTSST